MPIQISEKGSRRVDEDSNIIEVKPFTITIEHSLLSISKWESIYHKPFIKSKHSRDEFTEYIKCMTIGTIVSDEAYDSISNENRSIIEKYINDPMSATTFSEKQTSGKASTETGKDITSEYLYYAMFANQIPKECEKWHLNRLMALIKIFSIKNDPDYEKKNKMTKQEIYARNKAINARNRAKYHSKG